MWGFGSNPTLAALFKDGDDMELVETIALIVQKLYFEGKTKRLRQEHLHVMRVWETSGRCSNGGFRCLFDSDPLSLSERLAGLEAIGAQEAIRSIQAVVALFPDGRPHPRADDRARFLKGLSDQGPAGDSSALYDDAILAPLSDYVRERQPLFLKLPNLPVIRFSGPHKNAPVPGETASTLDVAAWILGRGGYALFHELKYPHGGRELFIPSKPLPQQPLTLAGFHLDWRRRDTQETFRILGRWKGRYGIEEVGLKQVRLADFDLAALQAFPHLTDLDLTKTRIGIEAVRVLAALPKLRSLNLAWTRVPESGLAELAPLGSLRILDLQGIEISGTCLKDLRHVVDLSIGSAQLRDADLAFLSGWQNLAKLEITDMTLSRNAVRQLASCVRLEKLRIIETGLREEDLAELAGHPGLVTLDVCNSLSITERGARLLLGIPSLKELRIWSERIDPAAKEFLLKERPGLLLE